MMADANMKDFSERFAIAARGFASDTSGATVVEYALVVGIIGAAVVVGTTSLSEPARNFYDTVAGYFPG